ncbi:MAG: hypothetical protein K0R73_1453, partial [Candidatus Midichloriaceae bacterium]|nr:hypothetical protein [Candidatus Midichloriaceae bacterium]
PGIISCVAINYWIATLTLAMTKLHITFILSKLYYARPARSPPTDLAKYAATFFDIVLYNKAKL